MKLAEPTDRFTWLIRLSTFALIVGVLRAGQDVLIPVAFAALLAFMLSPVVVRLMRWKLPKSLAIIVTVTLAFGILTSIGWLVVTQARGLVRELPNYEQNLHRKIADLKQPQKHDSVSRMVGMVENLRRELKDEVPDKPVTPPGPNETRPVPVEVRPVEPTPWQFAIDLVKPFLRPLGVAGIVIVFVVAMLFQREDLRDRL
ncbi:MAG TPA: AI-2E family transporter, partial [Opitutaceae bacterium]|nr:AI-2E family transporter [Opitutaceae bacterium]